MILQALNTYYERKAAESESGISPEGFEEKVIPYVVVIDLNGEFVDLQFTGDGDKFKKGRPFLLPMWQQKSGKNSWKTTNFLWDHYGYLLGQPKSDNDKDVESAKKQNATFSSMINLIADRLPQVDEVQAVKSFYDKGGVEKIVEHKSWSDVVAVKGCNLSFRINDQTCLVPQLESLRDLAIMWVGSGLAEEKCDEESTGICLISGNKGTITRLHRPISGINKKPSPFLAVNNLESPAFASFNKKQGMNFPISEGAAFKYATALNVLLRRDSQQKFRIGDVTTVFWSDRLSHMEDDFATLFNEPSKDNPDALTEKVRALLMAVDKGTMPQEDKEARFFILGLSPNAARISVRFWNTGTVAEFSEKISRHFHDLEIVHDPHQRDYLSLWSLLCSIAVLGKSENILPNLAGDWIRAILNGSPYPQTLLNAAIRRTKAVQRKKDEKTEKVSYERAALIKAFLNRKARFQTQPEKEITVSLDRNNTNPGYRVGRLFALLEKIQEEANPGINATIRDRYYAAASGTPASVLPILLRMKNHHLGKLEKGREIYFEKLFQEVFEHLQADGFPSQLSLDDQGRFAIGYYHQRQEFYKKSDKSKPQFSE
ncbi:type I-C CRISPR-associated protein Cas8c/Csd1 [Zobellella sp. DQSA1]|uniref:type I-C CRISPR-associated protein Cas8c/Csd1 n=1 Tax=Zobellella sp. DQSA1 TaxID=3342386 RepID=UPI0035C13778